MNCVGSVAGPALETGLPRSAGEALLQDKVPTPEPEHVG